MLRLAISTGLIGTTWFFGILAQASDGDTWKIAWTASCGAIAAVWAAYERFRSLHLTEKNDEIKRLRNERDLARAEVRRLTTELMDLADDGQSK